ncbi:DUF397 domain-containing protein [Actinomadura sp. KC216]|uniref:DUF397 domain-containing protein n=1 Tax=Actinomadura sp. KC216 TaxID=2530370 RepID=UPI00104CD28F|nr:DUF397 domain-containing protein [Actinomadura sp. KC216]TDB83233.1 DUF397 domain-containing protein [Actinomadura sp. KC216]
MTTPDPAHVTWRKSIRSSGTGQCVEVAGLDASVGVRDSKDPRGPVLLFTRPAWRTFIRRIDQGASST